MASSRPTPSRPTPARLNLGPPIIKSEPTTPIYATTTIPDPAPDEWFSLISSKEKIAVLTMESIPPLLAEMTKDHTTTSYDQLFSPRFLPLVDRMKFHFSRTMALARCEAEHGRYEPEQDGQDKDNNTNAGTITDAASNTNASADTDATTDTDASANNDTAANDDTGVSSKVSANADENTITNAANVEAGDKKEKQHREKRIYPNEVMSSLEVEAFLARVEEIRLVGGDNRVMYRRYWRILARPAGAAQQFGGVISAGNLAAHHVRRKSIRQCVMEHWNQTPKTLIAEFKIQRDGVAVEGKILETKLY